jgi:hypothetical protein
VKKNKLITVCKIDRLSFESVIIFLILTIILFLSFIILPLGKSNLAICLFKSCLGLNCPGCGMTRAFLLIGHGEILEALKMNINSLFIFTLVSLLWIHFLAILSLKLSINLYINRNVKYCIVAFSLLMTVISFLYNNISLF